MKFNIKKLILYYKPYKKMFFWDLFFMFLGEGVTITVPVILKYITGNVIFFERNIAFINLLIFFVLILILSLIRYCCDFYTLYFGHLIGAKIENDMRIEIFEHLQELPHSFFDKEEIGQIMSRITTDLSNISDFMHHFPEEVLSITTRFIGVFIVLLCINWKFALITMSLLPVIIFYIICFSPKLSKAFEKVFSKIGIINSRIEDSLLGIRTVKSYANEELEIKKFKKANEKFVGSQKETFKIMGWGLSGLYFLIMFYNPFLILMGSVLILNHVVSVENLTVFIIYQAILLGPIFSIKDIAEGMSRSYAGYKRFIKLLETKSDINDKINAISKKIVGNINIKDISFKYEDKNILKKFNLNISCGECVALVGSSGIGKSTICNLLPRFYEITSGEILIDNINIKDMKLKSLRRSIGFVQQNIFLFTGTIYENIQYGKPDATSEEIINSAKSAFAHDFIMGLPDKYDTQVGPRGIKLSGGQKQRIEISRVFLKNPPILIFDEATSSLDNESERYIQKSIEKLSQNRTTIIIAHKLTNIKNLKRILVMDNGRIAEEGSHEELLLKEGIYAKFYNSF